MNNEKLKKKYYELVELRIDSDEMWQWIEENCLQKQDFDIIPYQLCPKCNGQGQISKPPYIAGDVHEWSSSSYIFPCDVCNGSKIIPQFKLSK